jgi:hypothetical protein
MVKNRLLGDSFRPPAPRANQSINQSYFNLIGNGVQMIKNDHLHVQFDLSREKKSINQLLT